MSWATLIEVQTSLNELKKRVGELDKREQEDIQSIKDLLSDDEDKDCKQDKDIKKLKRAVNKLHKGDMNGSDEDDEEENNENNKNIPFAAFEELQKKVLELESCVTITQNNDINAIKDSLLEVYDKDRKQDIEIKKLKRAVNRLRTGDKDDILINDECEQEDKLISQS